MLSHLFDFILQYSIGIIRGFLVIFMRVIYMWSIINWIFITQRVIHHLLLFSLLIWSLCLHCLGLLWIILKIIINWKIYIRFIIRCSSKCLCQVNILRICFHIYYLIHFIWIFMMSYIYSIENIWIKLFFQYLSYLIYLIPFTFV